VRLTAAVEARTADLNCPTTLAQTSSAPPAGIFGYSVAEFVYQAGPNAPPAYENDAIDEEFFTPTAYGFSMNDLTSDFKNAHPSWRNVDEVAAEVFNSAGQNGSFTLDASNSMTDWYSGTAGNNSLFTAAAITRGGVGYSQVQTYTCGVNDLLSGTLTRAWVNNGQTVEIMKK